MKRLFLLLTGLLMTLGAQAHKPSDSYLSLRVEERVVTGQWDIALRDLDFALGLDSNGDGEITWGEVKAKHSDIAAYAFSRLQLFADGAVCPTRVNEHLIDDHTDGAYAVMRFSADCPSTVHELGVHYTLFYDVDPQHKGLLRLEYKGDTNAAIFAPETARQNFSLAEPDKAAQFVNYAREGVWHIWIGFDHILFLLALLLPAVVVRDGRAWQAVSAFKPAFWSVLKIVTAFTLAHSITLTLATLGYISLPSRWVESTIAASVVVAALNNIYPLFRERRWLMAFLFGLIHGFGFASVLADLGLPQNALVLALFGFNVGVEAGQLAIVAVFLPLTFMFRHTAFYRRGILYGGSMVIIVLATIWLAERALNLKLITF